MAALGLLPTIVVVSSAQAAGSGFTTHKLITRTITHADGTRSTDQRDVSVSADVTTDLHSRQVVDVNWTGARPSGNIRADVFSGNAWVDTEYPVLVLQCRGDDSAADAAAQIRPETCWTTGLGAGQGRVSSGGLYRDDVLATEADRAESLPSAQDWSTTCPAATTSVPGTASSPKRIVPFLAADGTRYWPCGWDYAANPAGIPSEMGSATPLGPNEQVAATRTDGTGTAKFEVRTAAENTSLGCSVTVPCAIVVIPIMGFTCADASTACNEEGLRPAGSFVSDQVPHSAAVTAQWWWSSSNWNSRLTIPITVAPTDTSCQAGSGSGTLQLYGSALLSGAAEQWRPAYCSRSDRFVLRISDQVEGTAFANLRKGYASGVVSTYPEAEAPPGTSPLLYSPIAVTGFGIAFVIDDPTTGKQLTELNLSPRLLAKLMTGSYPGTAPVRGSRSDLANNPVSMGSDPEFLELNPSLSAASKVFYWSGNSLSFASLLSLRDPSDVVQALTSYVAADREAMAFIAGEADPWGMTVNSAYKGTSLPSARWPLADPWTETASAGSCAALQPTAWFTALMSPVADIHKVATDLQIGKPESFSQVFVPGSTKVCQSVRTTYPVGNRAMLGLVTLADAARYQLPVASLRTAGTGADATFVAPTATTMQAAAPLMTSAAPGAPYLPDAAALHASSTAYPGTMVLHAAFPASGLDAKVAADAASFIKIATSEGQVPGQSVGQLPDGYAPLSGTGDTATLAAAAKAIASQLAGDKASTPATVAPAAPAAAGTQAQVTNSATTSQVSAASPAPAAVAGLPAPTPLPSVQAATSPTPATTVSWPAKGALPAGLALTAIAGVGIPLVRRTPRVPR
ncbi:MAG: hypothetical protein KJ792_04090 [Actinobacteria bacterium]|nr:hypothetical protein [Actinomycetota bacterium]MCG2802451.1 hypothetical protein [Cellulomonas sp.]